MGRIWSRSPATEAISSGLQPQGSTEENSIVCENLSIGEDFDLEDNCIARSQEHEGPDVKITNVYVKKNLKKLLQKVPRKR